MKAWTVRARSIYRKSRADEGRLGLWLVVAKTAEMAETLWRGADTGEWLLESVEPHAKRVIRTF